MGHSVDGFDLKYTSRTSWKAERRERGTLIDIVPVTWCCQSNGNSSCVDGAGLARAWWVRLDGGGLVFGLLMQRIVAAGPDVVR
jgi:hypothetical protein